MEKQNKNLRVAILVILAILVTAAGLFFFLKRPPHPAYTVKIGFLNITASLPLFIAEEKGFFTEEGVQYESIPILTSNQLVDGIAAGNLDAFPESSAIPVLALELQSPGRLKVFAVSSITKKAPFDALLVKENSPITKLSDLAGRKIGVFPGSTATSLLRKYLTDNKVDVSAITFVPIPPQTQITALLQGSVDAVHAYEPTTAIALNNGGVRKLFGSVYAEMLDPNPQGVAVISAKFLEQHPQIAKNVILAMERAMVFMRDHEAEARQIMSKRLKLDEAVARTSVFLYMLPHQDLEPSLFQKYADMLHQLGELNAQVKIDSLLYRE